MLYNIICKNIFIAQKNITLKRKSISKDNNLTILYYEKMRVKIHTINLEQPDFFKFSYDMGSLSKEIFEVT